MFLFIGYSTSHWCMSINTTKDSRNRHC
ncbi:hypothetical protein [Aneurinibacillus sp. REN35]